MTVLISELATRPINMEEREPTPALNLNLSSQHVAL